MLLFHGKTFLSFFCFIVIFQTYSCQCPLSVLNLAKSSENCYNSSNISNIMNSISDASMLFFNVENEMYFMEGTVEIRYNISMLNSEKNTSLLFSEESKFFSRTKLSNLQISNLRIVFKCENSTKIGNFFDFSNETSLSFTNCTFQILNVTSLGFINVINVDHSLLYIERLNVEKSTLDIFSTFLISNKSTVLIVDLICQENEFQGDFLVFYNSNVSLRNINFSVNAFSFCVRSNNEYDNEFLHFEIWNSIFDRNVFYGEAMKLDFFENVTIVNSSFSSNKYALFFDVSNTENLAFLNSTFVNNFGDFKKASNISFLELSQILIKNLESHKNFTVFQLQFIKQTIITSCIFERNKGLYDSNEPSRSYSTIFYLDNQNFDSTILIEQSYFFANQGILNTTGKVSPCGVLLLRGTVDIKSSIFEANIASYWNICFQIISNNISIVDSLFLNNSYIRAKDDLDFQIGGTLIVDFNYFTLKSSNFSFNTADYGTCILIYGGTDFDSQSFWGSNLNFFGNVASQSANAFYLFKDYVERVFLFENSCFLKGETDSNSGLFFFESIAGNFNQNFSFYDCFFQENMAQNDGALMDHYPADPLNCFLYFETCQFINNFVSDSSQSSSEGVIFDVWGEFLDEGHLARYAVQTKNCLFSGNFASTGAVINGNRIIYFDEGSVFENNIGYTEGGAILMTKSMLILKNSKFFNCSSVIVGGAISLREKSKGFLYQIYVYACFSQKGSFANADLFSAISINGSDFEGCYGQVGSIIFLSNGFNIHAEITYSQFYNNTSQDVLIYAENTNFSIQNAIFNMSSNLGRFFNCYILIDSLVLEEVVCSLPLAGCVLSIYDDSYASIENFNVSNVSCVTNGGVLNVVRSSVFLNFVNASLLFSQQIGGFLYGENSNFIIENVKISCFKFSLIYLVKCSFVLENSFIINTLIDEALEKSGIFLEECSDVLIRNSRFFNISTNKNGSHLTIIGSKEFRTKYEVYDSYFAYGCATLSGGSLYHANSIGIIQNCSFIMNKASIGGALNFFCDDYIRVNCYLSLKNNSFVDNVGLIEGGAIKWNKLTPFHLSSNLFLNNSAKVYGDKFANVPVRFGLNIYKNDEMFVNYFDNETFFRNGAYLSDLISGDVTSYKFEFFLVDQIKQKFRFLSDDASFKIDLILNSSLYVKTVWSNFLEQSVNFSKSDEFQSNTSEILGSSTVFTTQNNTFIFKELIFIGRPNSFLYLRFSSKLIAEFYPYMKSIFPNEITDPIDNTPYIFILPLFLTVCTFGEQFLVSENSCQKCPAGRYNFEKNSRKCYDCPANAICKGGAEVYVNRNFWRSGKFSKNVYQCESLEICLGPIGPECAANYKGIKCEQCDTKEGVFTKKNVFGECTPCVLSQENVWLNVLLIFMIISMFVASMKIFVSRRVSEEKKTLLKIIINYFQCIYLLPVKNALLLKNTRNYQWVSRYIIGFTDIFSLSCFYVNFGFNQKSIENLSVYNELSTIMIMITFSVLLMLLFWKIVQRKFANAFNEEEKKFSFHVILYFLMPYLSLKSILVLNCIQIDDFYFVQADLITKCWDSDFYFGFFFLSFPNLIFWFFYLPHKLFQKQARKPKKPKNATRATEQNSNEGGSTTSGIIIKTVRIKEIQLKSIFFVGYNEQKNADYEKILIYRKIFLVILAGVYERSRFRVTISFALYNMAFIHFFMHYPMLDEDLNRIESVNILVFCFNYYLLVFDVVDLEIDSMILFYSFTLLTNVSFLLAVAMKLFRVCRFKYVIRNFLFQIKKKLLSENNLPMLK